MLTPRQICTMVEEYWFLENSRAYVLAGYNFRFQAHLVNQENRLPELPVRDRETREATIDDFYTNDEGLKYLEIAMNQRGSPQNG